MSEATQQAAPATQGPTVVPPAAPLTAIQIVERQIQGFIQQHEKAIANVHAIEGAIQATQHLLGQLKQEEVKAFAAAKRVIGATEDAVEGAVTAVETDAKEVLEKAFGQSVQVLGVVEGKK